MGQGVISKNIIMVKYILLFQSNYLIYLLFFLFILIFYLYIYMYIYIYIYIFFSSYKSQNILPKWEDLQSLDFILCLYAVSCIIYLFYVL